MYSLTLGKENYADRIIFIDIVVSILNYSSLPNVL